jgi:hypothetical protein
MRDQVGPERLTAVEFRSLMWARVLKHKRHFYPGNEQTA